MIENLALHFFREQISDEIKKKLTSGKQQEEYQKWLRQMEANAKIEIDEDFFSK